MGGKPCCVVYGYPVRAADKNFMQMPNSRVVAATGVDLG